MNEIFYNYVKLTKLIVLNYKKRFITQSGIPKKRDQAPIGEVKSIVGPAIPMKNIKKLPS